MKNEWDLLAAIERRLAAGASLITVELSQAAPDEELLGLDDTGQTYALSPDFMHELFPFLRKLRVSFSIGGEPGGNTRTLQLGPGLPPPSPLPGSVNLLELGMLPSEYFGITPEEPDDSEHGEEWKRLL